MSILIKGIEMPKCCKDCFGCKADLFSDNGIACVVYLCQFTRTATGEEGVLDICPLIEVPDDNAPVKHGKWVLIGQMGGLIIIECSACHKRSYYQYNFCPECGAEMDCKDIYVLGKKEEEK